MNCNCAVGENQADLAKGRRELYSWLLTFSKPSLTRLQIINRSAASARHVVLAIAFGFQDRNIRRLNRMIVHLLLARMRAERSSQPERYNAVQEKLTDLHLAIDWATGELPAFCTHHVERPLCNKLPRSTA